MAALLPTWSRAQASYGSPTFRHPCDVESGLRALAATTQKRITDAFRTPLTHIIRRILERTGATLACADPWEAVRRHAKAILERKPRKAAAGKKLGKENADALMQLGEKRLANYNARLQNGTLVPSRKTTSQRKPLSVLPR